MDQLGPARIIDPQRATTEFAKVALSRADLHAISTLAVPHPGLVSGEVLLTFDLQTLRASTEVYGIASTTRRLATDLAVAE